MAEYTPDEVQEALRPIASLISKSEKAQQKLAPGTWQHTMLGDNIKALRHASALMGQGAAETEDVTAGVLRDDLRALGAMIGKTESAQAKFAPGTSQHSLARNRLRALRVAEALMQAALDRAGERAWPELRTQRLLLRGWTPEDRAPLAAMNADRRVMEFIGEPMTREESDAFFDRIETAFQANGYGFWAVEAPGVTSLVGFVGLGMPAFEAPFTPAVEVGWRLAADYWGRGYATEAARAALGFAFDVVGLGEVVAFTSERNVRSRRVMERLGMTRDPREDFDHPLVPAGSVLRRHVLYRIRPDEGSRVTARPDRERT